MSDIPHDQALPPHEVYEGIGCDLWGELYRALDIVRNRIVVLRVPRMGPWGPELRERFFREARAAAQLQHPHLLPILAVGLHDGRPCYTTPPSPNGMLSERREQFTDPRAAAGLVEKLAWAAAAAHAHGMIHRHLNPNDVLFDENDQPQMCGFGLARFFFALEQDPEAPGMGVPAYLAPEQLSASGGKIEASWDVWALGLILYELLTGRQPFGGGPVPETVLRILSGDLTPPRQLRPDLDRELEAVVVHSLKKRPDDRYPSARALAEDLERWLRAERTYARPKTLTQRILSGLMRTFRGKAP